MSAIKSVAITAASGALGFVIFQRLNASGLFKVRVLSSLNSKATFPSGTDVVNVDYNSVDSLKSALQGIDAVVSAAGNEGIPTQKTLIDAAIAAGVKRFLPSEFGSDLDNANARILPIFHFKVQTQDYLKSKVAELGADKFSYTFVYNSAFLDWGLSAGFLLDTKDNKPSFYDGGNIPFAVTTLSSVGDAVVGVLSHPAETANRAVYVKNVDVTQAQLYEYAKLAAPQRDWQEAQQVSIADAVGAAEKSLANGEAPGPHNLVPFLFKAIFFKEYQDGKWGKDNELLGIKELSDDEVKDIVKEVVGKE